ncbi:DNA-methyltransferase [Fusobacterium mortiferum]|uniref:Methyltransferase n=1 Tax=Fusobacterium mortiferum TaxID=850 RepID=A0ABS2G660_FUSMR|nr:site-specific DNA-methyltransferase [Fusobacterium mortiferum]MBM6876163.1 site-specific DNA-methyltransferase [Fusobacterium mortiferum]
MLKVIEGDCLEVLKTLPNNYIDCVVTSPPYWRLRDYNHKQQLGMEETPEEYINKLCNIFDEIYRVLKDTGTVFVNIGDSYSKSNTISPKGKRGFSQDKNQIINKNKCVAKKKSLVGVPAMFQLEMIKRGWILRNKIIWNKTNIMPESVKDRFTNDYEEIFFFTKNEKYFFNKLYEPFSEKTLTAFKDGKVPTSHAYLRAGISKSGMRENKEWLAVVSEKGRNMRAVWKIGNTGIKESHFSTFPKEIVRRCIESGCPSNGIVLDCFLGSGTTLNVAKKLGRNAIGIELNRSYIKIAEKLIGNTLFQKLEIKYNCKYCSYYINDLCSKFKDFILPTVELQNKCGGNYENSN